MKKSVLGIFMMLFTAANLLAQQGPRISFKESTHNFGAVKEIEGKITHRFVFKNDGNAPLVIKSVRASCGCTTPDWSKTPVLPGKNGFVVATYDPKNRPGAFHKSLTITSNATPSTSRLYIKGTVTPAPLTPERKYPITLGNIRAKYSVFHLGKVLNNKPTVKTYELYNAGNAPIIFTGKNTIPAHISVSISPRSIKPKETAKLTLTYDGKKKDDLGFLMDNMKIGTNDTKEPTKRFRIAATVEDYFPPMTEAMKAKAPVFTLNKKVHDFGNIAQNQTVSAKFTVTNTGKSDLRIKKTKTSCGCTLTRQQKDVLKPGESTDMTVDFRTGTRTNKQIKTVTVYTNDPAKPVERITIRANVQAPTKQ
ncbi:hypothetical protein FUAX_23710 [Fulvitalea axinellae]|uniref:DUF1573 domain-containing protein n=1 Tax=Fulvitalea axinellae TaxID=1182444 RepID=A0AAU9CU08_9BACT|nr:hypothetical protein FUAX_23710 [Fulvitalea axinellae]